MPEGSKVTRGLTIHLESIKPGNYGLAFKDRTTRSDGVKRLTEEVATTDSGSRDSCLEKIGLMFRDFEKSLKEENQGELYADVSSEKPRRDPKA